MFIDDQCWGFPNADYQMVFVYMYIQEEIW